MTKTFNKSLPNQYNVFCPSNIPMRRAVLAHTDALRAVKHEGKTKTSSKAVAADLTPALLPLRRAVMAHLQGFRVAKTV